MIALVPAILLGLTLAPATGQAQDDSALTPGAAVIAQQGVVPEINSPKPVAILQYAAPTSATWGPSPGAPPTSAFGKPAEVLLVVPGGYVVQQRMPIEQAMAHAVYVSGQIGQPVTVTIPDPAGGPPRVEHVGASRNDR